MRFPLARSLVSGVFASSRVQRTVAMLARARGAVFYLHRFDCYPGQEHGHRVDDLRAILESVRRARIDIISVDDAVRLAAGDVDHAQRKPFVAFSVDDCYWDFVDIALPVFAAYDAPVTGFVCPGLIEQRDWFWWDKLWFLVAATRRPHVFTVAEHRFPITPLSFPDGPRLLALLTEGLKDVSHTERTAGIRRLAHELDVDLPDSAPDAFRLASWPQLQAAESPLVSLGAHTMSHPVLATCDDALAEYEITESLRRVRAAFVHPSNVFCYPNGTVSDFGAREIGILRRCGADGAVTTLGGSIRSASHADRRFAVPRFTLGTEPAFALRRALLGR